MTGPTETPQGDGPTGRVCSGTVKHGDRAGQPCGKRPVKGTTLCTSHGGRAPQVKAAGERRLAEEKVLDELRKITATYGCAVDVDPGIALLEEVRRTAGHVAWLGGKVAGLKEDELVVIGAFGPYKNPMLAQYERERTHLAKVCADAVRCGLEARQVALAERIGEQVYAAMRAFALDLGHNPDDPKVAEIGIRHLRAVSG